MKNQRDTSLQIRLAGMAILGLFIVLAAAAYFSGRQVKRSSELITTDAMPGMIYAHKMRMDMSRSIGWVMVAASAQNPQSRDASLKTVHDADVSFTNDAAQYLTTIKINPAEDQALCSGVFSGYAEYYRRRMTYEKLILAGNRDAAAAFLETNLVPAYVAVINSAEELLKYNNGNSTTFANYIRNSVNRLYLAVAVVMVLALVCAAVLVVNYAIRRRELAKLRESEEKFSKAFRFNPSGIAITEMETGEYVEVNESFCRIMGYSSQELIGRTSAELRIWSSVEDRKQIFESLLAGDALRNLELQIRTRAGDSKTVLINAELIELGGKKCIVSLVQDITGRKLAEQAITASESALKEAQHLAHIGSSAWDARTDKTTWSEELYRIVGWDTTKQPPTHEERKKIYTPESFAILDRAVKRALATGEPYDLEIEIVRPDGERRQVNARGICMRDEGGAITGLQGTLQDITERKQSEAALRESERKYRDIVEQSPLGIFQSSMEGPLISVNSALAAMYGYDTPEQMINDHEMSSTRRYARPEKRQEILRAASESPGSIQREVECRRKDDTIFPANLYMRAVRAADGTIQYLEGFIEDISTRKQSQDELMWKTALLEAQVDSTLDGILVVDTTGEKILQNQRFLEMFQVPDEIAGDDDNAKMLQHAVNQMKNPQQFRERVMHLYEHPDEIGRDEIGLVDGRVFDRYSAPVRDKSKKHFGRIWAFRDITEQKRVEEEIRATNERYSQQQTGLMELTRTYALRRASIADLKREVAQIAAETLKVERVSIWLYERDHQSIVCQELFERSNQSHSAGVVLRAKDIPTYFRALAAGDLIVAPDPYSDPRTTELSEIYLRPLGISSMLDAPIHVIGSVTGVICCESVGAARRWTADEQTFTIAIANVISLLLAEEDRQQIEEQFRQSQKMEAIGQLASGVAHDFNNILAVIQMQSYLLEAEADLSPVQRGFAADIGEATQRAAALTRQLLLFSRKERMQTRELDLDKSITDMTKMLRRTLGNDIELRFKFSLQPLLVRADPGMMDQVLMNLAVNARDAMSKGGNLVIETSAVELDELSVATTPQSRPGAFVCLSVSDTGCGIPPEIMPKIFDPFFTTKEVGKGTGLGLATVFGIVQQHQGWINVYSEVGRGTTFRIYLPRLAQISDQQLPPSAPSSALNGNETILVVEDEPKLRASVVKVLSDLGYNVLAAHNGADALEVWQQQRGKIHLLLTDMIMAGGMSGKDLGEQLLKENPELKVIYVSGYSPEVAGKDFPLQEGVNFLIKPFQVQRIVQTIRKQLDQIEA